MFIYLLFLINKVVMTFEEDDDDDDEWGNLLWLS